MPYYVSKMIGKGTEEDPYRTPVANYSVNWVMVGQTDKGCLVYVPNPTPEMEVDKDIKALPKDLNTTFTRQDWNRLVTNLHSQNIDISPSDYDPARTVREVIIIIGQLLEPTFDINHFSAS
ncbi:hypothetical protein SAMN05660649_05032 [Desulfotomaculum arcticum]|uniref:Uncharacterized protein n=1 Tax=Desulfotruncus arcticus DSM 17038 TaxID=1121424 RepID=A0A1I2ZN34_9FIRM|nr:hypothetical protein [Desulfotruncus arcticus]SFH39282.1 hypothetical protein SAMN05660649_05032 [Desulfotomaculum arcticum] [Desulfotruncus arcticus DSM 17038]